MKRREFVEVFGLSATAVSYTGFNLIELDGTFSADCATSTDMLGPFYRKNAPERNDLSYQGDSTEIPLKVVGTVFGADCKTALPNVEIDIWHCDHNKKYDMESDEFRCRGKQYSDENGHYWYKTFVPPPYQGRPKHIHYLVHGSSEYQKLVTQLYFKGDKKIKRNNWVKYPWDHRRILEIYKNKEGISEVLLNLYLTKNQ